MRVDRAGPCLGLAAHGADPEGSGRMHAGVIRSRGRIVRFERGIKAHRAIADGADVNAVFGDNELPFGVDARQRACHPAQMMDADLSTSKLSLEQPSLENI